MTAPDSPTPDGRPNPGCRMSTIDGDLFVSLDDLYRFMEWVIEVSGPDGEILFGGALRLIRENFADATPAPAHPGGERPALDPTEAHRLAQHVRTTALRIDSDGHSQSCGGLPTREDAPALYDAANLLDLLAPTQSTHPARPGRDRDKLEIDVEELLIDHAGMGGTSALTDRILALTDAYAAAAPPSGDGEGT